MERILNDNTNHSLEVKPTFILNDYPILLTTFAEQDIESQLLLTTRYHQESGRGVNEFRRV